jgi:hypothetical protein
VHSLGQETQVWHWYKTVTSIVLCHFVKL